MIASDIINSRSKTATVDKKGTVLYKSREEVFKEEHVVPLPKAKDVDEEIRLSKVKIKTPKFSESDSGKRRHESKHDTNDSDTHLRKSKEVKSPTCRKTKKPVRGDDEIKNSTRDDDKGLSRRNKSPISRRKNKSDDDSSSSLDSMTSKTRHHSEKYTELTDNEKNKKSDRNCNIKFNPKERELSSNSSNADDNSHLKQFASEANASKCEKIPRGKSNSLEDTNQNVSSLSDKDNGNDSSRDSSSSPHRYRSKKVKAHSPEKIPKEKSCNDLKKEKSDVTDYRSPSIRGRSESEHEHKPKKGKKKHKQAQSFEATPVKTKKSKSSKKTKRDKTVSDTEQSKKKTKREKKKRRRSEERDKEKQEKNKAKEEKDRSRKQRERVREERTKVRDRGSEREDEREKQTVRSMHSESKQRRDYGKHAPSKSTESSIRQNKPESKSDSRSPSLEIIENDRDKSNERATSSVHNTSRSSSLKRKREPLPNQNPRMKDPPPRERKSSIKKLDEFGRDLSLKPKKPVEAPVKSNHQKTQKLLEALKFSLRPSDIPKPSPSKTRDKAWSRESLLPSTSTFRPRTDSASYTSQRQEPRRNSSCLDENFTGALGSLDDVYSPGDESPIDDVWPTKRKMSESERPQISKISPNKSLDDLSSLVDKLANSGPSKITTSITKDSSDTIDSDDMVIDSGKSSKSSSPKQKHRLLSTEGSLKSSVSEERIRTIQSEKSCSSGYTELSPKEKPRSVKTEGSPSSPLINTVTDLVIKMKQAENLNVTDSPSPNTPEFLAGVNSPAQSSVPSPVPSDLPSPVASDLPSPVATPHNSTPEYHMTPTDVQLARHKERVKKQSDLEKQFSQSHPADICNVDKESSANTDKNDSKTSLKHAVEASKQSKRSSTNAPPKDVDSKKQRSSTRNLENDRERKRRSKNESVAKKCSSSSSANKYSSSTSAKEPTINRRSLRLSKENKKPSEKEKERHKPSPKSPKKSSRMSRKDSKPEAVKEAAIPLLDESPPPPPPPPPRDHVIIQDHHREAAVTASTKTASDQQPPTVQNGRQSLGGPLVYVNNNSSSSNSHSTSIPDFSNGSMVRKRARLDPPSMQSVTDIMGSHSDMFSCLNDSYAMEQFNDAWDKETVSPTAYTDG